MKRIAACAVLALLATPALAKKGDKSDDDDEEEKPAKKKGADKKETKDKESKPSKDEGDDGDNKKDDQKEEEEPDKPPSNLQKQDLNGHDLGTTKKDNTFEAGRFFVDKVDSDKTEKGTLVQGSLTSTSFIYGESGGAYPANDANNAGDDSAKFMRMFTDLRLQTDFRHIGGGRWEGRIDFRARFVSSATLEQPTFAGDQPHIQSGFNGTNEYDLKELWLVRNGEKSDVFFGRQFIPDLGALKIDGLRIDYASSQKFTFIGFAGLYPIRGSRSLTTDYQELKFQDTNGQLQDAGQFTGAAGFGAAYRTANMYGAFGGVVLAPFKAEQPRFYGTSTGYWRYSNQLDFYHFAIIDLLGSNAVNAGLTNVSAGVNYKPAQRLRLTASYNRVDTDTLNVQAGAFLANQDQGNNVISNEAFIRRLATTQIRGGVSAGLGDLQRFELSTSIAYRYRPGFVLTAPDGTNESLPLSKGVEFWAGLTDRHSFANMRLGVDYSQSFGIGSATQYQRNEFRAFRVFGARELESGKGEWEAEVSYATTTDSGSGMGCSIGTTDCFGSSSGSIVSFGGNLYYRFNRDWFTVTSAYLSRTSLTANNVGTMTADPAINGLTGFFRIAYRF
jgi:hypothetical protein